MHPDDLKVVWRCRGCGRNFLFNSDAQDHAAEFNHEMETLEISYRKRGRLEEFRDSDVTISFRIRRRKVTMKVTYRYYPRTGQVLYTDVLYSEQDLRNRIENDISMMQMVDNYLRSHVEQELAQTRKGQRLQQ